ncbi:MAG: hypothetical protein KF859_08050 [Phycisphaeraceae bacterium]|nr:hypothetical protein [Phycisphaeraceae bacterium]
MRSATLWFTCALAPAFCHANAQTIETGNTGQYLLIGMGPVNDFGGRPGVGQAVNMNNFELGANKAPVPSTSSFLTGGSSGGPGLLGNVPNIPLNAAPIFSGVCGDGNIAITSGRGVYNLQDVGVYADLGVHAAQSASAADAGTQNSFFNDPHFFPNTFTSTGFINPLVNGNTGGFGVFVGPGAASPSSRMAAPLRAGVTGGVDFNPLMGDIAATRAAINALPATMILDLRPSGGVISSHRLITVPAGISVIDVLTNGSDVSLNNANLVIDGPDGARVIVRIPRNAKMNISNGNILAGKSGIGLNAILFYSDRLDNAQHFNFNNSIVNGVAFWSVGARGGSITFNNAQGCTQIVADKIVLNDVRFCRCAFGTSVCISDFNGDGGIDGADVQAFFEAWENGLPEADVNQDGGIDGQDAQEFFNAWKAGSC